MNIIIHKEHVQDDGDSETQRFTQTQRTWPSSGDVCASFTHSGHIIRFMLQCELAPRLSGYIIPAPSLKSTEDGDGNWRIYVSWHGFLAHCPPSLRHPDSSVVYAAVFNPINLKVSALHNPYPLLFFALFFLYLSNLTTLPSQRVSSSSHCLPPRVFNTWLHYADKWNSFSAVHLLKSC